MITAAKRIIVNGEFREPGQPVPEALTWKYPAARAAVNQGQILDPDGEIAKKFAFGKKRERLSVSSPISAAKDRIASQDPFSPDMKLAPTMSTSSETQAFVCCGKVFQSPKALKGHQSKVHKGRG